MRSVFFKHDSEQFLADAHARSLAAPIQDVNWQLNGCCSTQQAVFIGGCTALAPGAQEELLRDMTLAARAGLFGGYLLLDLILWRFWIMLPFK